MSEHLPVVIIVGGGFGGLAAAKALKLTPAKVILIDRANHRLFQPLLYQAAMYVLAPAQIASPIRSILRAQNTVLLGEVTGGQELCGASKRQSPCRRISGVAGVGGDPPPVPRAIQPSLDRVPAIGLDLPDRAARLPSDRESPRNGTITAARFERRKTNPHPHQHADGHAAEHPEMLRYDGPALVTARKPAG